MLVIRRFQLLETPPRTWRRRTSFHSVEVLSGNTSTYVEKTVQRPQLPARPGNTSTYVEKTGRVCVEIDGIRKHLHVRGEDDVK